MSASVDRPATAEPVASPQAAMTSLRESVRALLPRTIRDRLGPSSVGTRLARATVWSAVGACVSRGLSLVTFILVARVLGKERFGEWGILRATVAGFQTVAGFGLGDTVTTYIARFRCVDSKRAGRILAITGLATLVTSAAAALLLVLLAPWLAAHTLAAPHLADELRICVVLLLLSGVQAWQGGAFAGLEAFKAAARVEFWGGVASFLLTSLGAWRAGLTGALCGMAAAAALRSLVAHLVLNVESTRAGIRATLKGSLAEFSVIWRFTLPVFLASVVVGPTMWLVQAFLVNRADGYRSMAEFTAVYQWRLALGAMSGLLCAGYLPVAASVGRSDPDRGRRMMLGVGAICATATLTAAVLVAMLSGPVLAAYGEGFASAHSVLLVMLGLAVIDAVDTVLFSALLAAGRAWWRLFSNGCWVLVVVISTWLLVPSLGSLGLAIALVAGQTTHLALQLLLVSAALRPTTIAHA